MRQLIASFFAVSLIAACGGADSTTLFDSPSPTTTTDASPPNNDASSVDAALDSALPPGVCDTDANNCKGPDVPQGWTAVAYSASGKTCPKEFAPGEDVVSDAMIGAQACSCSCSKTQDPDCQTGTSTISGVGMACGGFGAKVNFAGGKCTPINGTVDDYDKATTIPPMGGTCNIQPVPNDSAITSQTARLCPASPQCQSAACGGYAPKGFTSCIVSDGDVACPASSAFSNKHLVGAAAHVACNGCGSACTFVGKCDTPKLNWYTTNNCSTLIVAIPADGTCTQTNKGNTQIGALSYTATPNFTGCTATATPTPSLDLQKPRTVCCR